MEPSAPSAPSPYGQRQVPFEPVEIQPGLVVRLLREDELASHQAALEASDLYPTEARARVRRWWRSPTLWLTVVTWRGRILQYDHFHLSDTPQVGAGLTLRPERDRPRWFWREMRRPVLDALLASGFRTMSSAIRADRRDWIEVMKDLWLAVETGRSADGRWIHLHYDVATARAQCTGFPIRRSATVDGLREVGPSEAAAIIQAAWGIQTARARAAVELAEDAYGLDQATLLAFGPHLRAVKPRSQAVAALTNLTPMTTEQPEVSAAIRVWLRAAQYARVQTFVPEGQHRVSAAIRAQLEREGFRRLATHRRGPTPVGQWEAAV